MEINSKIIYLFLIIFSAPSYSVSSSATLIGSYELTRLGLVDGDHTSSTGNQLSTVKYLNEAGKAAGTSGRYSGSGGNGQSAWFYNGSETVNVGFTDASHTNLTTGYQYSTISEGFGHLNEAGSVVGTSDRYTAGTYFGRSAWIYDGNNTVRIGLVDSAHTSNIGEQSSGISYLNQSGHVTGYSSRYSGNMELDSSLWIYNGNNTVQIGLIDSEHTSSTNQRNGNVRFLNNTGHVAGDSFRYSGTNTNGSSTWVFNGSNTLRIGLIDTDHTSSTNRQVSVVSQLNNMGQATGTSVRFPGGSAFDNGRSAWLYDGSNTNRIGLTDAAHTSGSGEQDSFVNQLNDAGHAIGYSQNFLGAGSRIGTGRSAWIYDGTQTKNIGLIDFDHTAADGFQHSYVNYLNGAGHAAGGSSRFSGQNRNPNGESAWLFDGNNTIRVGLIDDTHTNTITTDNIQNSFVRYLNESGQAAGQALRYTETGFGSNGESAWLYDGTNSMNIGLTDTDHTFSNTYQFNKVEFLNESGQAAGYATRVAGGQSAWLYDPTLGQTLNLTFSERDDGFALSSIRYLGENGLVLGNYTRFNGSTSEGLHAFAYTIEDGFSDFDDLISGGLDTSEWEKLAFFIDANGMNQITGDANLIGGGTGAYLLTPSAVPVPAAVWLFGSSLIGLMGFRKNKFNV